MTEKPVIYVVDSDAAVRLSLHALLREAGYRAHPFVDAEDLLASAAHLPAGCVLMEVDLAGLSGLEAQERLSALRPDLPVILMNGAANVPMAVRALKSGAVDFIEKPFARGLLLDALEHASQRLALCSTSIKRQQDAAEKIARLTAREREVVDRVVQGEASRIVAQQLGLSVRTVEMFRASAMRKLGVRNVADLVKISLDADGGASVAGRSAAA